MNSAVRCYIGLGSNLETPIEQVERALQELDTLPLSRRVAKSSLYATAPIGPQDQPDFINAVACLETHLSPLALLDQLQALEQRHRRRRLRHWGPRTLDLDVLLYGKHTLQHPRLTVPHEQMHARAFVLVPLAEVSTALQQPITLHQQPLETWLSRLNTSDIRHLSATDVTATATI
ncbi:MULTISPECIES: 2-amino-4-hydroxy-6-hydroxymethyldihydropteridine diphosphokinase [unclassified Halomonas]|uniref:2-amino-4-hydroxy-6- hydroxymethyldihydropteridine diphosphokinase n=1 Tax=unclassified Halomonas TaxID=2609666 RepID=UPI001EF513C1|nr:2-amino-4-hydroxy-6-hydroxymethyldihydropteridine diphosphokinase [Halomonas sp. A020]MCG7577563.1 2-amino-4-hydroxy-6-hydroxymethyldihydropteridine diphosphokinase [Halomonas sp. MMH1-48]MCG7592089.1 2-amino-4-hydroxy-6-hydroxymethyldihydropteridine diphosphokinase [Halomonas sp. McD50-5]MCG7604566.1 2-amino-4-hydroxy-6-hydroxymethyldihydropteridine diphosphokinase [Halomonas sp. MM17-34]MCG7613762.1 2-amino-4-hydroxy-6-hydroxymethyldihydropteridine diphosphokinase [Halomonas sp. MM17-29]M